MLKAITKVATIYWKQQQAAKLSIIILIANINGVAFQQKFFDFISILVLFLKLSRRIVSLE